MYIQRAFHPDLYRDCPLWVRKQMSWSRLLLEHIIFMFHSLITENCKLKNAQLEASTWV